MKARLENVPLQDHSPLSSERDAHPPLLKLHSAQRWDQLWVILASGLYLCLSVFTLDGTPFLLGGDQVYFWLYAQRMLSGQHVYRDFFQFTPPGTDLVYVAAFQLLGQKIWVVNLVALALGVTLSWLCFRIGRAFLSRWQAMLAASLFMVLFYGKVLIATHHWYSALAVLAAVAILMPETTRMRIAMAGVMLGVAMFFTQTRGPAAFAGFAIYLVWQQTHPTRSWRECCKRLSILFVSMVTAWLALNSYFLAASGSDRMWYWLVTYLVRYHASGPTDLGLPQGSSPGQIVNFVESVLVYLTLPLVYAFSLWEAWSDRSRPTRVNNQRLLLTLAGLAITLEVAMSPNWLRVYCVSVPGVLLLVWSLGSFPGFHRYATGLLWFALISAACWGTWSHHQAQNSIVHLPAGQAATEKIAAEKLEWIAQHTRPGDYFFQAAWPGVYLPLHLRNPAFVDAFLPTDETRPELVAESIRQLETKHVRYILWAQRLNAPNIAALPETYHLAPFRQYMTEHYRKVLVFQDHDELWERQ